MLVLVFLVTFINVQVNTYVWTTRYYTIPRKTSSYTFASSLKVGTNSPPATSGVCLLASLLYSGRENFRVFEFRVLIYNIYTWFVGSKHSHWLMVVRTILLWQITECSLVGRWSFSVMISELCGALLECGSHNSYWSAIRAG
jgi:hypothetical protein